MTEFDVAATFKKSILEKMEKISNMEALYRDKCVEEIAHGNYNKSKFTASAVLKRQIEYQMKLVLAEQDRYTQLPTSELNLVQKIMNENKGFDLAKSILIKLEKKRSYNRRLNIERRIARHNLAELEMREYAKAIIENKEKRREQILKDVASFKVQSKIETPVPDFSNYSSEVEEKKEKKGER